MASIGSSLSDEEARDALAELSRDGSGSISFEEYCSWFEDHDVRRLFAALDRDASGALGMRELEQLLSHLGISLRKAELKRGLSRLDRDSDGAITYEEFLPWWRVRAIVVGDAPPTALPHIPALIAQRAGTAAPAVAEGLHGRKRQVTPVGRKSLPTAEDGLPCGHAR